MFSFLGKNVLPRRRDLFPFSYSSSTIVRFVSTDSTTHNSCVAHVDSLKNPDAVITLLKDNGFSTTQISKIAAKYPFLLSCNVDKTLKPKFDFFRSQGITASDLAQVVSRLPYVLMSSLEKTIIPCFDLMRSMVPTDAKLLAMLKRSPSVLMQDPQNNFLPNLALLRAQGVSADNIATFLVNQPRTFLKPTCRFGEIVEEVKKLKFNPAQYLFLMAVHGLTSMTRSTFKAKVDIYKKWGLSEDEVRFMFRKNPHSMMISEKNIMSTMSYFVNEMGCTPSVIAEQPIVLMFSLKRRIIPRCSVIQVLTTKGLLGKDWRLDQLLKLSEINFLEKYVIKFEKEVPELLSAYQKKGI